MKTILLLTSTPLLAFVLIAGLVCFFAPIFCLGILSLWAFRSRLMH